MKKNLPGLIFTLNSNQTSLIQGCTSIVTKNGKVAKKFADTVLKLENGQKIYGYVKEIKHNGITYVPYPQDFEKAVTVLTYLGVSSTLIDEEPNKKTKGKYVVVQLSDEQEVKLGKLKSLC